MSDFDFRWFNKNGIKVLQWRRGTPRIVSNSKYDRFSDLLEHGKYINKTKWGKWKDVREEEPQYIIGDCGDPMCKSDCVLGVKETE